MPNAQVITVSTTATNLLPNAGTGEKSVILANTSGVTVYIGNAAVTTATGYPVAAGASGLVLEVVPYDSLWGIVASGTAAVAVLTHGPAR